MLYIIDKNRFRRLKNTPAIDRFSVQEQYTIKLLIDMVSFRKHLPKDFSLIVDSTTIKN